MILPTKRWLPLSPAYLAITVALAVVVIGCGPGDVEEDSEARQQLFESLTAWTWCNEKSEDPTRVRYSFRADGTYGFEHFSDYPVAEEHGDWNFLARSTTSGFLFLDNGEAISASLRPNGSLQLEERLLDPCDPLSEAGRPEALRKIELDPLFEVLTAATWHKSDDFTLFRAASSFDLHEDGTYVASYRFGACEHYGLWSLRFGIAAPAAVDDAVLITNDEIADSDCNAIDEPDRLISIDGVIEIDSVGRLTNQRSMYTHESLADRDVGVYWTSDSGYLEMRAEYDRPLEPGRPTTLRIEIENTHEYDVRFGTLTLSEQILVNGYGGFVTDSDVVKATAIVEGVVIPPGGSHEFMVEVEFTGIGDEVWPEDRRNFVTFGFQYEAQEGAFGGIEPQSRSSRARLPWSR